MRLTMLVALLLCGCSGDAERPAADSPETPPRGFEPPVMTNAESPVAYPPGLYADGVEGSVILRLFVDESGDLAADSTQIAEGSGRVEFDSAAVRGVSAMRFAPARRDGTPVATAFLQPVHFRLPTER